MPVRVTVAVPPRSCVAELMETQTKTDADTTSFVPSISLAMIGGPDYVKAHPRVAGVYLTIAILASVVGTLGNLGILGAVILNKNLHHSRNAFIVNLAIADLCMTACADPFGVVGKRGKLSKEINVKVTFIID